MNNNYIYISKGNGKAYKGKNGGIDLSQTVPHYDLKEYTKQGENNLFEVWKPKKIEEK